MFRRVSRFIVVLAAIVAIGCGAHKAPNNEPKRPTQTEGPAVNVEALPPSCFSPVFLAGMVTEWYHNLSAPPANGRVLDQEDMPVCEFFLKGGDRKLGPALWSHYTEGGGWHLISRCLVSNTNDDRTVGAVSRLTGYIDHTDNLGWDFTCRGDKEER